jgi:hypothetical protein
MGSSHIKQMIEKFYQLQIDEKEYVLDIIKKQLIEAKRDRIPGEVKMPFSIKERTSKEKEPFVNLPPCSEKDIKFSGRPMLLTFKFLQECNNIKFMEYNYGTYNYQKRIIQRD